MTEPVLIRVWDNERKPLGHCVRPFFGGYFTIPEGDPLARAIVDASEAGDITVTVFTQHEFEWHVTDFTFSGNHAPAQVHCVSHNEYLRGRLCTDEQFLALQNLELEQ